jgi:hypothetical protein
MGRGVIPQSWDLTCLAFAATPTGNQATGRDAKGRKQVC